MSVLLIAHSKKKRPTSSSFRSETYSATSVVGKTYTNIAYGTVGTVGCCRYGRYGGRTTEASVINCYGYGGQTANLKLHLVLVASTSKPHRTSNGNRTPITCRLRQSDVLRELDPVGGVEDREE